MVGLDVTHRAMLWPSAPRRCATRAGPARVVADLHALLPPVPPRVYGHDDTPVHDALAVAHVIRPDLLRTEHLPVEIDIALGPGPRAARSSTAAAAPARRPNARVALDVDADGFIDLLTERIGSLTCRDDSLPAPAGRGPAAQRAHGVPRVGAGRAGQRCASAARDIALEPAGLRHLRGDRRRRRRRRLRVRARRRARCPTRARAGSPRASAGPSRVVDPLRVRVDRRRLPRRRACHDAVIYELHVGTFSPEGTFDGAIPHLRDAGRARGDGDRADAGGRVPRRRGWGYDGVYLCAAQSSYGGPHGLQRLVDAAHAARPRRDPRRRLQPRRRLRARRRCWPSARTSPTSTTTPWGAGLNVDDEHCDAVREWVCQSAELWVRDFHLDGLRLDAIHAIVDSSPEHLVAEIARRVHTAARARS